MLEPTRDKKQKLPAFSEEVAVCVGELFQAAEAFKGGICLRPCLRVESDVQRMS